jgi:phage I-like protein
MKIQYILDKILDGKVPTERLLFVFGENKTTKGTFILTEKSAQAIMDEYKKQGNKLVFDYNHMQLAEIQTPESSVSAGTYDLEIRTNGLYAINIEWTDKAKEMILAKEYIYTSPAFWTEIQSGKEIIVEVINCALTNIPATFNMDQLMAASKLNKRKNMADNIEEVAADLPTEEMPVEELPKVEDLIAQISELQAKLEEKDSLVKDLEAKLAELTGETELTLTSKTEEITKLSNKVDTLEKDILITSAITNGKLNPAQKELYISLSKTKLVEEIAKLPKNVILNKTVEHAEAVELTDAQKLTAYINKRVFGR